MHLYIFYINPVLSGVSLIHFVTVNQGELRKQQAASTQTDNPRRGIYTIFELSSVRISARENKQLSLFTDLFCFAAGLGKKMKKKKVKESEC